MHSATAAGGEQVPSETPSCSTGASKQQGAGLLAATLAAAARAPGASSVGFLAASSSASVSHSAPSGQHAVGRHAPQAAVPTSKTNSKRCAPGSVEQPKEPKRLLPPIPVFTEPALGALQNQQQVDALHGAQQRRQLQNLLHLLQARTQPTAQDTADVCRHSTAVASTQHTGTTGHSRDGLPLPAAELPLHVSAEAVAVQMALLPEAAQDALGLLLSLPMATDNHSLLMYIPSASFAGAKPGYIFGTRSKVTGYHLDFVQVTHLLLQSLQHLAHMAEQQQPNRHMQAPSSSSQWQDPPVPSPASMPAATCPASAALAAAGAAAKPLADTAAEAQQLQGGPEDWQEWSDYTARAQLVVPIKGDSSMGAAAASAPSATTASCPNSSNTIAAASSSSATAAGPTNSNIREWHRNQHCGAALAEMQALANAKHAHELLEEALGVALLTQRSNQQRATDAHINQTSKAAVLQALQLLAAGDPFPLGPIRIPNGAHAVLALIWASHVLPLAARDTFLYGWDMYSHCHAELQVLVHEQQQREQARWERTQDESLLRELEREEEGTPLRKAVKSFRAPWFPADSSHSRDDVLVCVCCWLAKGVREKVSMSASQVKAFAKHLGLATTEVHQLRQLVKLLVEDDGNFERSFLSKIAACEEQLGKVLAQCTQTPHTYVHQHHSSAAAAPGNGNRHRVITTGQRTSQSSKSTPPAGKTAAAATATGHAVMAALPANHPSCAAIPTSSATENILPGTPVSTDAIAAEAAATTATAAAESAAAAATAVVAAARGMAAGTAAAVATAIAAAAAEVAEGSRTWFHVLNPTMASPNSLQQLLAAASTGGGVLNGAVGAALRDAEVAAALSAYADAAGMAAMQQVQGQLRAGFQLVQKADMTCTVAGGLAAVLAAKYRLQAIEVQAGRPMNWEMRYLESIGKVLQSSDAGTYLLGIHLYRSVSDRIDKDPAKAATAATDLAFQGMGYLVDQILPGRFQMLLLMVSCWMGSKLAGGGGNTPVAGKRVAHAVYNTAVWEVKWVEMFIVYMLDGDLYAGYKVFLKQLGVPVSNWPCSCRRCLH